MAGRYIPIFTAERNDGLGALIASTNSLAYITPVHVLTENLKSIKLTEEAIASAQLALGQSDDFDLFPVYNIMVSTGWNKNDDVFGIVEAWLARHTPEDKPFNEAHIPSKIIGHITGSVVVDENLDVIPDDTPLDALPDKFHILARSVVYRHIKSRDKALETYAAELIEGIQSGKWFVSMECLFSDFDYAMITSAGEHQIVERNEKTAFLTKHLRIYRGSGEYNGCKIGRVLKNITFSGKGLVENPANPDSIILNDSQKFIGVLAEHKNYISIGEKNMSEELLKEQVKSLQESLAAANRKLEELGTKQVQASLDAKDAEIVKLQGAVSELSKKVEELTVSYNDTVKAKTEAETTLQTAKAASEALVAERDAVKAELDGIKAESRKTNRISTLVDKGVDKAVAEELVNKFATFSDENFEEIVKMQSELVEAKKTATEQKTEKKEEECKEKKAKANEDPTQDPAGESTAAGADLGGAQVEPDPALATSNENDNKDVIAACASYFDKLLGNGCGQKKN